MKRTVLFVIAGILLITSAVALGLSLARIWPPLPPEAVPETKRVERVELGEREVVITLPPVIITSAVRRVEQAAVRAPPSPEGQELRCGEWKPLASDETQTVRYCEAR